MKTSKRVLSFFMAVVMALTACSAGFVAFARETNPKDNNPFSDKYASAEMSSDALNELLDSLLPTILDAIGEETLASIGVDAEKVKNANYEDENIKSDRFFEFISELSVFLFDKVGKTSMDKVLNDEGLSSGNAETDAANYAYVNDDNAAIDFWSLYNLCKTNADANGTDFQKRCNDYYNGYTKEDGTAVMGLKELLFARDSIGTKITALNNATTKKIFDIAVEIGVVQKNGDATVIADKTATEIQALIDAYEAKNGAIEAATDEYDLNLAMECINKTLEFINSKAKCSSVADLIFYQIVEEKAIFASIYNAAAIMGGAETGVATDAYDSWFEVTSAANPTVTSRQELADKYVKTIISDSSNLENSKFYSEYIEGLLLNQGYSADEITAMVAAEGLTQEDLDWLATKPGADAYQPTPEQKQQFPYAPNSGSTGNILGNTNSFYNAIVCNSTDHKFSNAVNRAFGKLPVADASIRAFRTEFNRPTGKDPVSLIPNIMADINTFAHTTVAANVLGNISTIHLFDSAVLDSHKNEMMSGYVFEGDNYPFSQDDYFNATASVIDGYIELAKDLDNLLASFGVNMQLGLNGIIDSLLPSLIQTKDKDGNPLTYDLIISSVEGIYSNLAKDPMGTLANVVPLLTILIDELIVPLIFNGDGDAYNQFLDNFIFPEESLVRKLLKNDPDTYNMIFGFLEEYGITTLSFDLNYILPAVTDYIVNGSTDRATMGFYDGVTTTDGRPVPIMVNVQFVDKMIAESAYNCKFLDGYQTDENGEIVKDENGNPVPLFTNGIKELLHTVLSVLNDSVFEYVDTHNTNATADTRIGKEFAGAEATIYKGLNNITVGLPQLINIFVKNFLALYNTKGSDWQFDARIAHGTGTVNIYKSDQLVSSTEYGTADNATVSALKQEIFIKNPANVTAWIVNLLVNDWLNAVVDLLNDVLTTENDIANNIPIITNLLNSLGGFGETSIITDALNGLFYLTRNSQYSFTFEEQAIPLAQNGETYVGLSDDSAYYLIANAGPIIEIVMDIVNANQGGDDTTDGNTDDNTGDNTEKNLPVIPEITIDYAATQKNILNKENEKASEALISAIDSLLSTIFENTYLNGYTVDKLDGVLSGVVTSLVNTFGKNTADKILKLVRDYLEVLCYDSVKENFAPKRNINNPGPVNEKKVYTNKQLSILITETYSLLEEILDEAINIKGDDNDYIVNAIDGIFSPSSIAVRSNINGDISEYLTWCELSASKYANDLGFDFKAGDKDAFYDGLFEALAPITAIVGALLGSETGLYDNVVNPVLTSIADKCDIKLYTPVESTGKEYMKAVVYPLADVLGKFLEAPASTLIGVLQSISGVLTDSSIQSIVKKALPPIAREINGLVNIIEVLSPSLNEELVIPGLNMTLESIGGILDTASTLINGVTGITNMLIGMILGGIECEGGVASDKIKINFNWDHFANTSKGNALLMIYSLALDTVLDLDVIQNLIKNAKDLDGTTKAGLLKLISQLDAKTVFEALAAAIRSVRTPTEILWTFEDYLAKETNTFKYPSGISASEADDAVDALDNIVKNVFPLLKSLDVLGYDDLAGLVNGMLFKNDMITTIAKAVYGGIESKAGNTFTFSPAQLADYLMDRSYGNTYSDAAAALRKCSSWSQVSNINWGFKDGSANAEQGFINALAALCRPVNDVLAVFLAGSEFRIGDILEGVVKDLALHFEGYMTEDKKDENGNVIKDKNGNPVKVNVGEYSITLRDGELNIYIKNYSGEGLYNRIQIDVDEVVKILNGAGIVGGNGYESAIIPLLEALMCDGVKTNDQYINDYNKAKDNLLINVLNPLFSFVDKLLEKPFDTLTAVLPNVAYFIDNNGIGQLLNNLLSPVTQGMLPALKKNNIDVNAIIEAILGTSLGAKIAELVGVNANISLDLNNLNNCDIQNYLIPIINGILKSNNINITLPDFKWSTLASHGTQTSFNSAAGGQGIRIVAKQGETLIAVLRYIADVLISNSNEIKNLICGIDAVAKNKTIVNILTTIFNQIAGAHEDDIVKAIFYLLTQDPQNSFFDYRDFKFKDYDFSYPSTVDVDFLTTIGPMLDGLIGGLVEGGLNQMIGGLIYKDDIISSLVCGLYGAVEGVKINDNMNLAELLAQTDIDFTTSNVAKLLTDKDYGQSYASVAKTIEKAGSWSKVNKDSLHWGVTDRDSFVHALCAALRPIYGVLDVLLNDGSLGLFKLIYLPGSDGYTSAIVPLMEAFGLYNIKTQYQYRQDMSKEYDAILLDILNPLLDKVEDILNAPLEMLCDILPNLSLFFANDGLLQLLDNLLLPITALLDSLKPIVDVNDLLKAVGLDIEKEIGKLGIAPKGFKFDIYNLSGTLKPLIGADNIVSLLNSVLGMIEVGGSKLNIKLMPIDWYQLASHGELITDEASQAATFGARMYVKADQSEVLIAVLRYLINTVNYENNFDTISNLIGGLLGDVSDSVSDIISQVLGMLTGETDEVISSLCELLQTLA